MVDLTQKHRVKTMHIDLSVLMKKLRENAVSNQNIPLYYNKHKDSMELHTKSCMNFKDKGQNSKKI